jgi:hypothetical protein
MTAKTLLQQIDLGKSVAEFEDALERYFVQTEAFKGLRSGRYDIVAGDKGTGKTAMYRYMQKQQRTFPELSGIELIAGFNPTGNTVFQRLVHEPHLTEAQYASIWKAYILSLVGNWALQLVGDASSDNFKRLDSLLRQAQLRAMDDTPVTVFGRITNAVKRFFSPQSLAPQLTFSESGIPIVGIKAMYDDSKFDESPVVPHEEALQLLDECIGELGVTAWIALDRLDEAFQGFPKVEIPALRALFRTYLDPDQAHFRALDLGLRD